MNCIKEVANLLGVKMNEDFKIKGEDNVYRLLDNGLCKSVGNYFYFVTDATLAYLINGELEIEKLPLKPKWMDRYYYVTERYDGWIVCSKSWFNELIDVYNFTSGNYFNNGREAEENVESVKNEFKKYFVKKE